MATVKSSKAFLQKSYSWMGLLFLSFSVSCAKEPLQQPLCFKSPLVYPESFDWDASHGRFLLGSLITGSMISVSPEGNVEEFVNDKDYSGTSAVLGIHVDLPCNRVLVAVQNTKATDAPFSAVATHELDTKQTLLFTELHHVGVHEGEKCMVNNVVADSVGNACPTNSHGDFIWKVTMEGIASVFAKNSIFLSQLVVVNSSVAWSGLNGLAYHTEGTYLLVVQSYSGAMFKVDLERAKVEVVNLNNPLTSVDGIALQFNGGGLVAGSLQKAWLLLESKNNWESAAVIDINPFDPSDSIAAVTIQDQYQMYVFCLFLFLI
ncbi:unnamed protein product [Sphagnum compactum]